MRPLPGPAEVNESPTTEVLFIYLFCIKMLTEQLNIIHSSLKSLLI